VSDSPIFVVGCPRSGTSLLRDLLRSHPNISIPPESHFIPLFYAAWGDPRSERRARALGRRILSLRTIRRWELELEPSDFAGCRSFAEILDTLYGEFARVDGKPRWGDKTPQHIGSLPLLHGLFPEARFVHIYRDGRDTARSWAATSFTPGNVYRAAERWRHLVRQGRRDGAALGDHYHEVRYETLLEAPEETMRGVCEFLDEPYTDAVTRRAERRLIYGERQTSRPPGIDPGAGSRWRREMPVSDRAAVESVAGDLLAELGYELEGLAAPIPARRAALLKAGGIVRSASRRVRGRRLSPANWILEMRARLRSAI
jgi:hypothetical protein